MCLFKCEPWVDEHHSIIHELEVIGQEPIIIIEHFHQRSNSVPLDLDNIRLMSSNQLGRYCKIPSKVKLKFV
jgi:hypothetical protein